MMILQAGSLEECLATSLTHLSLAPRPLMLLLESVDIVLPTLLLIAESWMETIVVRCVGWHVSRQAPHVSAGVEVWWRRSFYLKWLIGVLGIISCILRAS
jgi:hypothetical protein